jgi:hypothetical protein
MLPYVPFIPAAQATRIQGLYGTKLHLNVEVFKPNFSFNPLTCTHTQGVLRTIKRRLFLISLPNYGNPRAISHQVPLSQPWPQKLCCHKFRSRTTPSRWLCSSTCSSGELCGVNLDQGMLTGLSYTAILHGEHKLLPVCWWYRSTRIFAWHCLHCRKVIYIFYIFLLLPPKKMKFLQERLLLLLLLLLYGCPVICTGTIKDMGISFTQDFISSSYGPHIFASFSF